MAGYYYGQLSKEKKAVYDMLAAGCDALAHHRAAREAPAR